MHLFLPYFKIASTIAISIVRSFLITATHHSTNFQILDCNKFQTLSLLFS